MNENPKQDTGSDDDRFDLQSQRGQTGLIAEFWAYLRHNRKWWLAPIVIALLLLAGLVWLGCTAAAPFIYTLF